MTRTPILSEAAAIGRLAGPLVVAQLSQVGMAVTDTVMAGHLGPTDLAAVALGTPLWFPVFLFCVGVLTALTPIVAQLKGAGRLDAIGPAFRQAVWLAVFLGVLALPVVLLLAMLPQWMALDPQVVPVTQGYASAVATGMPAACVFLVCRFLIEGIGKTRPTMYVQIAGLVANAWLDYVLMFGKLGFPAMGAVGTGWATALVLWLQAALMLGYVRRRIDGRHVKITGTMERPRRQAIGELLRIGLPIAGGILMEVGLFAAVTLSVGHMGAVVVAAHQIALNYASLMFMVPLGIAIATTVRVSQHVGAGALERGRLAGWIGVGIAAVFMTVSAGLMLAAPEWIAHLYTGDRKVRELAVELLFFAAVFQLFDGIQVAAAGALRGFKDTMGPLVVGVVAYWVIGLPSALLLGFGLELGAQGLWAALAASLGFAAALLLIRLNRTGRTVVTP